MIRLIGRIPDNVYIALSGGPDSMAILDFVRSGRRNVTAVHFHHGTEHGQEAYDFVDFFCRSKGIPLEVESIKTKKPNHKSTEEYWRDERYNFLSSLDGPVITGHHLDDAVEWWLFSSLHGLGKLIPYKRENIIRPFLLTRKSALTEWIEKRDIPYIADPGNNDEKYMRSIIRNKIVPEALRVNPGLRKVLFKKLQLENVNVK